MFGRFVTGFKQVLQVQSEPPTPSPGSPIPGGQRVTIRDASRNQQMPVTQRYASSDVLERSTKSEFTLDGLSDAEREHILNVMARAESNVDLSKMPPMEPDISLDIKKISTQRSGSMTALPLSTSTSVADIPLDGLTDEERSHILRVMARAESGADIANAQKQIDHQSILAKSEPPIPPPIASDPDLVNQLHNSGLEDWELAQIMSVMNKARRESDVPPDDQPAVVKGKHPQQQASSELREESGVFNEAPRRYSSDYDEEPIRGSDDEEGVHSSDETEGADDQSPIEEGSEYSSPSPVHERAPESVSIEDYPPDMGSRIQEARNPLHDLDPALLAMLPDGIELLSQDEQEQIIAVLKRAMMMDAAPVHPPVVPVIAAPSDEYNNYPTKSTSYRDPDEESIQQRRRVPDLRFDISEDQSIDQRTDAQKDSQKTNFLGGVSPVSIMIQPPSPCPTETSSEEEDDDWTQAQKIDYQDKADRDDQEEGIVESPDKAEDNAEYDEYDDQKYTDQPDEVQDQGYEIQDKEYNIQDKGYDIQDQKYEIQDDYSQDQTYDLQTRGYAPEDTYDTQDYENQETENLDQDYDYQTTEETVDNLTTTSIPTMPNSDETEISIDEHTQRGQLKRVQDEDFMEEASPISDHQRSPTEGGHEADNEEECFDRLDPESSPFEDTGAVASSIYAGSEYYAEYLRSESGSSSGYGSRGILGVSSYASGETLSQPGAPNAEIAQFASKQTAIDSGLSRTSSLQEPVENVDKLPLMDEHKFHDIMTKSAPAEGLVSAYEETHAARSHLDYYEEKIETHEMDVHEMKYYSSGFTEMEPPEKTPVIVQHDSYDYGRDKYSDRKEIPQSTPEKRQQPFVPSVVPKTPEKQSFFDSLKQAANAPTPKSAFGSFFTGASQALKSQTEAVLKKAVDTVNQVANAGDVGAPKLATSAPPTAAPSPARERKASIPTIEPQPIKTGSMDRLIGDYDYDSPYSLKRMIRHEPIIPTKEEILVQQVHQPVYAYDQWSNDQKKAQMAEPLNPAQPKPELVTPQIPSGIIEVPGMPDLDLSLFNEEERAHLMAMIGKAKEMESELQSAPTSAAPSRSASFSHHGVTQPVVMEEDEIDEDTIRLLESYKAVSGANIPLPSTLSSAKRFPQPQSTDTLPWPVPSIREIRATPECHVDVEQAFANANIDHGSADALHHQQQQYDSSEVSSAIEDEADQQQRMTEIEADLNGDVVHPERYAAETSSLAECPLCNRIVLRCSQGSYGSTGQMCADCGVVVCTDCGSVVPRYMGKVWLCGQCQFEEQAQIQKQYEQQQQAAQQAQIQASSIQGSSPQSMNARRRRRRTTSVSHKNHDYDEEDEDEHIRPSKALSQDEPKIIVRAMAKPARDGNDSDESDEDINSQRIADDDDYPDEVIEVPPAPLSPEPAAGQNANMDNGMVSGGGFGADVLAAITSTFSSSSEYFAFGDAIDSSPEKRSHLQQQHQITGFTTNVSACSLAQTTPPPVPARTHRAAPPPPAVVTIASQVASSAGVFTTAAGSNHYSIGTSESSQFPAHEKSPLSTGHAQFESNREIGQQKTEETNSSVLASKNVQETETIRLESHQPPESQPQMEKDSRSSMEDEQAGSEEEEEEEEEQIDYAQAMKYYNNNPFFTHRPGPVYTIPEDEESDELSAELGDDANMSQYKDRPGMSPNYQQLLKQHQQQQQLRQQQQHQMHLHQQQSLHQPVKSQPTTTTTVCQPSSVPGGFQKRNPFIDEEEEEYENEQRDSQTSRSNVQQRMSAPVCTVATSTREVTSLVSSQQYFASQQQLQQKSEPSFQQQQTRQPVSAASLAQSSIIPIPSTQSSMSAANAVAPSVSISSSTSSLPLAYTTLASSLPLSLEEEYGNRPARSGSSSADIETRYSNERAGVLVEKRQTAPIDYTSSSGTANARPMLAFHEEDSQQQPAIQTQMKAREKPSMGLESTVPTSSANDELFYQAPTMTAIGHQFVWKRDDQQDSSQPPSSMSASQTSTGSEDEEGQDLDNQFVSKLKRSPAMILHADAQAAAAAAAAAAGRRPQPAVIAQNPPQQSEFYEDILTEDAPVAWPTFMGQKTAHQLPPFPPPPGTSGTRQRYQSDDQSNIVVSSGLASTPSSTISGGPGGVTARPAEMGRRKLPSIPQTSNINAQSEQQYGVAGHYGTAGYGTEQHQLVQHEQMNSIGQNWRPTTSSAPAGTSVSTAPPSTGAKDQRIRLVHATPSLRMPATLARVLLKQELREALIKRQQQLEACEIEANQRQYCVQRYLHTGVYPASVGLQPNTPRTVMCTLPADLLVGCRIQYHPPSAQHRISASGGYGTHTDHVSYANRPWSSTGHAISRGIGAASAAASYTRSNASTSTKAVASWPTSFKDACMMTEPELPKTSFTNRILRPSIGMSKNNASMTMQFHDAETQTWATTTSTSFASSENNHRNHKESIFSHGTSRMGRSGIGSTVLSSNYPGVGSRTVSTSTEDLDREREHANMLKKQHRKLRAVNSASASTGTNNLGYYSSTGSQRDQHQSKRLAAYFSDEEDDMLTREMRKSKIKEEIARRRQNLGSSSSGHNHMGIMTDFNAPNTGTPYYPSDYSSHVPHYGSLPRMDLPRHHQYANPFNDPLMSRSIGAVPPGALDAYGMQNPLLLPPARRAVSLSGGENDYWRGYYGGRHPSTNRGLTDADYFSDFGDYMSMSRDTSGAYGAARPLQSSSSALRQMSNSAPYLNILSDTPNYRPLTGAATSTGPVSGDTGLLSHYASYLNREFANSSNALISGSSDPWRRAVIPDPLQMDGPFSAPPTQTSQNQPLWPSQTNYMTDRSACDILPNQSTAWRSSMPYASTGYRAGFQPSTYPNTGLSMPTPNTLTDQYGYSTYPDRSWMRNSYRPAYQHQFMPPSTTAASLPSARSLDALRSSFGLTNPNTASYGSTSGTAAGYANQYARTPYWNPLEISAMGADLNVGSYPSGTMTGGFGSTVRYDSGYSSGGAGAGYASDSYHSNMGGLIDRQQSTLARSLAYNTQRPNWSSSGTTSGFLPPQQSKHQMHNESQKYTADNRYYDNVSASVTRPPPPPASNSRQSQNLGNVTLASSPFYRRSKFEY